MKDVRKRAAIFAPLLFVSVAASCRALTDLDDLEFAAGSTAGSPGATGSSSSGGEACEPGTTRACYTGPEGTEAVSVCAPGTQPCNDDGHGYGPCEGDVTPKPEDDCATPIDETCGVSPQCGSLAWARTFGGAGDDIPNDIAAGTAPASPIALTGACGGAVTFGAEATDCGASSLFIASFDASGSALWARTAAPQEHDSLGVAVTPMNDVAAVGFFSGDMSLGGNELSAPLSHNNAFLARYTQGGAHVFSGSYGDAAQDQRADAVVSDAEGNTVLAGTFAGTISIGGKNLSSEGNEQSVFVAKLDAAGDAKWARAFQGSGATRVNRLATDSAGNLLLTGSLAGLVDFGSLVQSAGSYDMFLVKLNEQGLPAWAMRFGDTNDQRGLSVTTDAAGDVIFCGLFKDSVKFGSSTITGMGDTDGYVVKQTAAGELQWSVALLGAMADRINDVTTDAEGNVYIAGFVTGDAELGEVTLKGGASLTAFAAKLDMNGKVVWARALDTIGSYSSANGIVWAADGGLYVQGHFKGEANFGVGPVVAIGGADIFLLKLAP